MRFPCEAADGGGEIDGSGVSEPIEGRIAERRKVLGCVTTEDRAAVLAERRIAHEVDAVFDGSPVIADERQELGRVGASTWQRRHVVGSLGLTLAALDPFSHHSTDLLHAGPADVMFQRRRGGDGSRLQATVSLVERAGRLLFSSALALTVGGLSSRIERQDRRFGGEFQLDFPQ